MDTHLRELPVPLWVTVIALEMHSANNTLTKMTTVPTCKLNIIIQTMENISTVEQSKKLLLCTLFNLNPGFEIRS